MDTVSSGVSARAAPRDVQYTTERLAWVDICRGIGIVLVVIGHGIGGLRSARQIAEGSIYSDVFYFIYTFHMPMFLFLAGLFIQPRVAKDPGRFLKSSLLNIAYPYALWSMVQLSVTSTLGALVNSPVHFTPLLLLSVLWGPPFQFWFLYILFFYQAICRFALPLAGASAVLAGAIVLRIAADMNAVSSIRTLDLLFRFALFFALGVQFGPRLAAAVRRLSRPYLAAGLAAALWVGLTIFSLRMDGDYLSGWAIPAAIAGTAMVIALARAPDLPGANGLAWLGRQSMPIYLLHVMCVAGTRIALKALFGITEAPIVLPVAVAMGLAVPLLVSEAARRLKLKTILGLGG